MEHERLYSKLNYSGPSIGMNTLVTYALRAYISKIHIYIYIYIRNEERTKWGDEMRGSRKERTKKVIIAVDIQEGVFSLSSIK